jgi:hypothetical protein
MKIRPEEIDTRIAECIDAWQQARQHCASIENEGVRQAAERIADGLRDESIHDCLAPLYRAAVKGKNGKKTKRK